MPLRPNFIERQFIKWGMIPGLVLDMAMPTFLVSAFVGAGEIDLFRKMNEGPASLQELAVKTNSNERALQNLLQVLEPLGYVEKNKGEYSLTGYARKVVPIGLFKEMIPFIKHQIYNNTKLAGKALREAPEEGVIGWEHVKTGEVARSYQVTMRWLAGTTVGEAAKKIDLPERAGKMLDIGGSHGLYCVEMCRKHPNLNATVFDWPIGIENAKETLERETDVADRIDTVEGDFFKDELPRGYDLALLGNIIHGNNPDQNKELLEKIADATTERGTVAIIDQFDNISGSRFTESVAALIGWNLFLFANGRAYDVAEVEAWLEEAGFPDCKVRTLRQSPGFSLLIASKT